MYKPYNALFLLITTFSASSLYAQQATEAPKGRKFENQLGFNATNFIQTLINFNGTFFPPAPFDANYKFLVNLKKEGLLISAAGLRTGVGYTKSSSEFNNPTGNTFSSNKFSNLAFRVGGEAQVKVSKYWTAYVGVDYVLFDDKSDSKNQFNSGGTIFTTTTSSWSKSEGWGPVLGVQFNIHKRICLGTEMTFYMTRGSGATSTNSDFPGSFPQKQERKFSSANISLPNFVNFNIRF